MLVGTPKVPSAPISHRPKTWRTPGLSGKPMEIPSTIPKEHLVAARINCTDANGVVLASEWISAMDKPQALILRSEVWQRFRNLHGAGSYIFTNWAEKMAERSVGFDVV